MGERTLAHQHAPLACLLSEKQRGEQLWESIDIPAQVGVDMQMDKHSVSILSKLHRITPAGVWYCISFCCSSVVISEAVRLGISKRDIKGLKTPVENYVTISNHTNNNNNNRACNNTSNTRRYCKMALQIREDISLVWLCYIMSNRMLTDIFK